MSNRPILPLDITAVGTGFRNWFPFLRAGCKTLMLQRKRIFWKTRPDLGKTSEQVKIQPANYQGAVFWYVPCQFWHNGQFKH